MSTVYRYIGGGPEPACPFCGTKISAHQLTRCLDAWSAAVVDDADVIADGNGDFTGKPKHGPGARKPVPQGKAELTKRVKATKDKLGKRLMLSAGAHEKAVEHDRYNFAKDTDDKMKLLAIKSLILTHLEA